MTTCCRRCPCRNRRADPEGGPQTGGIGPVEALRRSGADPDAALLTGARHLNGRSCQRRFVAVALGVVLAVADGLAGDGIPAGQTAGAFDCMHSALSGGEADDVGQGQQGEEQDERVHGRDQARTRASSPIPGVSAWASRAEMTVVWTAEPTAKETMLTTEAPGYVGHPADDRRHR